MKNFITRERAAGAAFCAAVLFAGAYFYQQPQAEKAEKDSTTAIAKALSFNVAAKRVCAGKDVFIEYEPEKNGIVLTGALTVSAPANDIVLRLPYGRLNRMVYNKPASIEFGSFKVSIGPINSPKYMLSLPEKEVLPDLLTSREGEVEACGDRLSLQIKLLSGKTIPTAPGFPLLWRSGSFTADLSKA